MSFSRQQLFLGFCVTYFQALRGFTRTNVRHLVDPKKLFLGFALVSQFLFEASEKEHEKIVLGLYYQTIDDWKAFGIEPDQSEIRTFFDRYREFFC